MRKWLIAILFLTSTAEAMQGQSQATVGISEGGYGMVRTNIGVKYNRSWGHVGNAADVRASYECVNKGWISVSLNSRYQLVETDFGIGDLPDGIDPKTIGLNGTHSMGQVGFTTTLRTQIGGRPFMGLALANSEWGDGGFERLSATVMGLSMVRADRATQLGIGLLGMVNTSSKVPVFPVVMYRHRFDNRWLINVYGGMMGVDYTPTGNDLISVGCDIDVKAFYFKPRTEKGLPDRCRFTLTSFRPMAKYRRRLSRNLYVEAKGGVSLKMSCRVNGRTGTKEYFRCKEGAAPFVEWGLSYSL